MNNTFFNIIAFATVLTSVVLSWAIITGVFIETILWIKKKLRD